MNLAPPKFVAAASVDGELNAPLDAIASAQTDPIAAILQVLHRGEHFLVCSHAQPDGDAVGSMLAMGILLEQMGKCADLVTPDRIPAHYHRLPGVEKFDQLIVSMGRTMR